MRRFPQLKLNNALLLTYKTYLYDLTDFEKLFEKKNRDYQARFLNSAHPLEEAKTRKRP